jgi:hypothetical protein
MAKGVVGEPDGQLSENSGSIRRRIDANVVVGDNNDRSGNLLK